MNDVLLSKKRNYFSKTENRYRTAWTFLFLMFLVTSNFEATAQNPYFSTTISQNGELMIGQTDWTANSGGCTNQLLDQPFGIAIDAEHGKMYVADYSNNRVLRFNYPLTGSKPEADLVFGQPDFTSKTINNGGLSASCLFQPISVAVDASGNLWVSDLGNKRILRYPNAWQTSSNKPNADVVLGVANFTTAGIAGSYQITLDDAGNLWAAGSDVHQVFKYAPAQQVSGTVTATTRFGLPGAVSGTAQNAFYSPTGVCMIGTSLFVADYNNHRVLRFDDAANLPDYANASACIGQPDYATNTSGTDQNKFKNPHFLTTDSKGNLYVTDNANHRVLVFNDAVNLPGYNAKASSVLGQPDFTTGTAASAQNGLSGPTGIAFDPVYNKLFVSDKVNQRVVRYATQDNALAFDGVDDHVQLYNPAALNFDGVKPYTFAAWIKADELGSDMHIFSKFNTAGAQYQFWVRSDGYIISAREVSPWSISSTQPIEVGKYYYVTTTYDGSTLKLYINGELNSETIIGAVPDVLTNILIGANHVSDAAANFFKGNIDELSIWNVALNETEIITAMQAPLKGTESGLVAYYDFNIGNPGGTNTALTTLYAKIQNGDNGTLTNFALSGNTSNYVKTGASIQPTFVSAVTTQTDLTINWTCGGAPDNYLLSVSTDPFLRTTISGYDKLDIGSETSYTVTGLSKGATYYFNVWAVKDGMQSNPMGIQKTVTKSYEVAGNALSFDGVDDYVDCGNDASLDITGALTLEAWINPNSTGDQMIMSRSNTAATQGHAFHIHTGGLLYFTIYGHEHLQGTVSCIKTNEWQHVAVVFNGSDKADFYHNGIYVESVTTSSTSIASCNENFLIGTYASNNNINFNGTMDEVRVWNKARTAKEIRQTMDKTLAGNEPNLAGYWNFDEGSGTTVNDLTSNNNDGTLEGGTLRSTSSAPLRPADIRIPGAITFDGVNDYVSVSNPGDDRLLTQTFSVAMWVKPAASQNDYAIFVDAAHGGTYKNWAIQQDLNNVNQYSFFTGENSTWNATDNFTLPADEWSFLVVTRDGDSKQKKVYINGVLKTTKTGVGDISFDNPGLVLGTAAFYNRHFKGSMDEFGFYNKALSLNEIKALYMSHQQYDGNCQSIYLPFDEDAGLTSTDYSANDYPAVLVGGVERGAAATPIDNGLAVPGSLKISKGYYSNKITLEWKVNDAWKNIFGRWYIYRKNFGADDSTLVYSSDLGSNLVLFEDNGCDAGTLYEYIVVGETDFGGCIINTNGIRGIGYRSPTGVVNGRITYEGGSAVKGARVIVSRTTGAVGKSMLLSGTDYLEINNHTRLNPANGITIEAYVKPSSLANNFSLLKKEGSYEIFYNSTNSTLNLSLITSANTFTISKENVLVVDSFMQVTGSYNGSKLVLYVNGMPVANTDASGTLVSTTTNLIAGYGLNGNLDELRLWNFGKDSAQISIDYFRILTGGETGIVGYWRMDEGVGTATFDQAHVGSTFYAGDAYMKGAAAWSSIIPTNEQLGLCGITNENGDYTIAQIGYLGSGENFTLTPFMPLHKFDPSTLGIYLGEGSQVMNGQNFTDVSSFKVTGTVKYKDCDCYVKDVYLKIDDEMVLRKGTPVKTAADGSFEIDVPIGYHSIQLWHQDHTFESGEWPPNGELHNFQNPVTGIEFIDSTRYTVIGRIVGGTREGNKKGGLGLSKNNIGTAKLKLISEQGNGCYTTTVATDPITGEYIVKLPPQRYIISDMLGGTSPVITNSSLVFPAFDVLDLSNTLPVLTNTEDVLEEKIADIVITHATQEALVTIPEQAPFIVDAPIENGKALLAINNQEFMVVLSQEATTATKKVIDRVPVTKSISYHKELNFIYRSEMDIDVTDKTGEAIRGEEIMYFFNELTKTDDEFNLAENPFDYPVFVSGYPYQAKISVFENYENFDENALISNDRVPVNDATLIIENDLAKTTQVSISLDDGDTLYSFIGGNPNVLADVNNPQYSFTKKFSVQATTPNGATASWLPLPDGDKLFRGYVFGSKFINGTDFVTRGPQVVTNILRDPPGSGSSAFIEAGKSYSYSQSMTMGEEMGVTSGLTISLGPDFEVGFGFITEVDVTIDIEMGLEATKSSSKTGALMTTTTTTQTISTSDEMVGADADIYMGNSTNFYFGVANRLQLVPEAYMSDPNIPNTGVSNNGFAIGVRRTLLAAPGNDNTSFMYTGYHIKNAIIPNLIALRNQELQTNPDYELVFTDASDPKYGANNDDLIWGENRVQTDPKSVSASEILTQNDFTGPSYIFKPGILPVAQRPDVLEDKVREYNQQIRLWQQALAQNEKEKAEARFIRNVSFSAGANYDYSESITTSKTVTYEIESNITTSMGMALGGTGSGIGAVANLGMSYSLSYGSSEEYSNETTNTYGYSLNDTDEGDYFSIDVLDPLNGHSPVFKVKGGRSMCPYEDAVVSEFYQNSKGEYPVLSAATIQREKPSIFVEKSEMFNVPENSAAEFILTIGNESGSNEDMTYQFAVDDLSNPNGASISIDDDMFTIPAGGSIQKVLRIEKGKQDVYDYEDIIIYIQSPCDESIFVEQALSVHFVPSCTEVNLKLPFDQFTVNNMYRDDKGDYNLTTIINDYDMNRSDLKRIQLQYKPANSSQWIGLQNWWKNEADIPNGSSDLLLESSESNYSWNISQLIDGNYNLRAMSYCTTSESYSPSISGKFDRIDPAPFGNPKPATGILTPADEIMIEFNEPILEGALTWSNFDIRGVLNGAELAHGASVHFDGTGNQYMIIPEGINLTGKPFTIEFWAKKDTRGEACILSQGSSENKGLWVGFDQNDNLTFRLGGQSITTANCPVQTDVAPTWHHYAASFDKQNNLASLYIDGEQFITNTFESEYDGMGRMLTGKSTFGNENAFNGNIHELRLWNENLSQSKIVMNINTLLSGLEKGLLGNWRMDEGMGTMTKDYANGRNGILKNNSWQVLPAGDGYSFDGVDDYLSMASTDVLFTQDMDFTIEFWFKGENPVNQTFISNGRGDGTDENSAGWTIATDTEGAIWVHNKGLSFKAADAGLFNGEWHHFALSVNRLANINSYIDGEQKYKTQASSWGPFGNSELCMGTRMAYLPIGKETDNFFTGKMDEIRVWNLARSQQQIARNINSQQTDDTPGLVAYIPFENYENVMGVNLLTPELSDQSVIAHEITANGGAGFAGEAPNIKLSLPVSKVNFSYLSSEDRIVFTPTDPAARLENCILDITVQKVRDLNGNTMQSPATWSVYVNMNQVNWEEQKIDIQKPLYESKSFTANITNKSGQYQRFSIENLPSWITASPQTGTLSPLSSEQITFYVSESMNAGYYNEEIYLSTDFDFDEKLELSLRVYAQEPEWLVDGANYQYSMNIIGQLKINDVLSTDKYDKIAAFVGNQCRGVANLQYIATYDMYQAYLDIYSNTISGDTLTFRVWDASEGSELRGVTPELVFASNSVLGLPSNPIVFNAENLVSQTTKLSSGWNWISFNLNTPDLSNSNALLKELAATSGDLVQFNDKFDMYNSQMGWIGSLTSSGGFDRTKMYKLRVEKAQNLVFVGEIVDAKNTTINLNQGWNWLGFTPRVNISVNEALAGATLSNGDVIKNRTSFSIYDQGIGWIGSLKYLQPGSGYMLKTELPSSFVFPENGMSKKSNEELGIPSLKMDYDQTPYADNMTLVAEINTFQNTLDPNDIIYGIVNGVCKGIGYPIWSSDKGKFLYFITLTNNKAEEYSFKVIHSNTNRELTLNETLTFNTNTHNGTLDDPFQFTVPETSDSKILAQCYPNPFFESFVLSLYSKNKDVFSIEMTDIMGRIIKTETVEVSGKLDVRLSADFPGLYFLRINNGTEQQTLSVVKF